MDLIEGKYKGESVGNPREIMRQIASGLQHLHRNNIVHRDIKPVNILISFPGSNGRPMMKLADFGLCRIVNSDGSRSDLTPCGSPGWMAPEMCNEGGNQLVRPVHAAASFHSDIFPLGCVFSFAFSDGNKHPFGTGILRNRRIENKEMAILTQYDFKQGLLFDLIKSMVKPDGPLRYSIDQVLSHPFFNESNADEPSPTSEEDYDFIISQLSESEINDSVIQWINRRDGNGRTPLMTLCRRADDKLLHYVSLLLNRKNVDVKAKDLDGHNALTLLCEHYDSDDLLEIAKLIIDSGIEINSRHLKTVSTL